MSLVTPTKPSPSLELLAYECRSWEMWKLQGSKGPTFWESRRALIAEIYGQLADFQITKYEAKYCYNFLRMG